MSKTTSPDEGHCFSLLTTNLATLKKPEGDLEGPFWSYRPMAKTFLEAEDDGPRWWSGQGASGRVVSLVFLYLCHSVFDWLHSHRFLYLPVKPLRVFFLGGGGAGKAASPTPFHYQPTPLSPDGIRCPHICIVCQSRTPTPNPLFEQTRTHELTRINSHKLVLYYDLRIFGTPIAFDKHWISFVMSRSDMGDFFHTGTSVCEIIWQTVFFRTFANLIGKKLSENTEMTAISK